MTTSTQQSTKENHKAKGEGIWSKDNEFEPSLPSQFPVSHSITDTSERELWRAVLLQSVKDATYVAEDIVTEHGEERLAEKADAVAWFEEENNTDVGGFQWVCDHLDLNPDIMRSMVLSRVSNNKKTNRVNSQRGVYGQRRITENHKRHHGRNG